MSSSNINNQKEHEKNNPIIGPLLFKDGISPEYQETFCILCDDNFNIKIGLPIFLGHLFEVHNIVIEDIQNIPFLPEYIKFWKEKFKVKPIEEQIPNIKVDSTDRKYFLISSLLKDDKELRHKLNLKHTLQVQDFERTNDKFSKSCFFCKFKFEGTRPNFLEHLSEKHNLQLGNPQNLVYIEELINLIETKFENLECIYCAKKFPSKHVLKEHMRKKLHKRINPKDKEFDKFYIVNYLEIGKSWIDIEKESDKFAVNRDNELNSDEEYSDWKEEIDQINCFFCDKKEVNINILCAHMTELHNFNFFKLSESFDFYEKIKLVNFIRRQIHNCHCVYCDEIFDNKINMYIHMKSNEHYKLPESKLFNQPEYYFPTYENDAFLYSIDDIESNE